MADFGDFLRGFAGQMLQDRQTADQRQHESSEWEKRQRLLQQLELETEDIKSKRKRSDGQMFKDENGQWVVQQLDGHGNPVGVRKASPAEILQHEASQLDVDMKRDEFQYRPEERSLDKRYKEALIAESAERARQSRLGGLAGKGGEGSNPERVIDTWLMSNEGKMAVAAYGDVIRGAMDANPNLGGRMRGLSDMGEGQASYEVQQMLKEEIMRTVAALPPDERPRTPDELKALVTDLANRAIRGMERNKTPR